MAALDVKPMDYEEYALSMSRFFPNITLTSVFSYEALPPNFTVLENCTAGAFAGIAVSFPPRSQLRSEAKLIGAKEHSVMYPVDMLKVGFTPTSFQVLRSRHIDTPSSPQARARRPVYRSLGRFSNGREGRRVWKIVERRFQCNNRSWYISYGPMMSMYGDEMIKVLLTPCTSGHMSA